MGSSPFAGSAASASAPQEEPNLKTNTWRENSDMITAASFLPPSAPNPKPWHRVPVPAANPRLGERKIWKRFGLLCPPSNDTTALAELQSQGHGSRKRARTRGFVRAWGDASWDVAGMRHVPDGKWDLVEARVSVTAAKEAAKRPVIYRTKRGSFDGETLAWVPRKRHNTRWPIEQPKKTGPMLAELQPLVEFEVPTADMESKIVEPIAEPVDDTKMRRRSTRRLSRRLSLAPIEESLDEAPVAGSPVKATPYYSSPLKRSTLRHLSPTKVSMSPVKEFTVSATPSKVMVGRPDFRIMSPMKSPMKGSNLESIAEGENTSTGSSIDEEQTLPATAGVLPHVLFDQPQPDVVTEPQYEMRRRASLHNARRSGRRSSGVERLLNFETHKAPNRRHSFMPQDIAQNDVKGRRHTLDIFSVGADQITVQVTSPEEEKQSETGPEPAISEVTTTSSACAQDVAVDVDVRTNLDIFGNSPVMQTNSPKRATDSIAERMASSPIKAKSAASSSRDQDKETFDCEKLGNLGGIPDALGISHEAPSRLAASEQAATTSFVDSYPQQTLSPFEKPHESGTADIALESSTSAPLPTPDSLVDQQQDATAGMSEHAPEPILISDKVVSVSPQSSLTDDDREIDLTVSRDEGSAAAFALTDGDSASEEDDTMSDINPDEDISTALRVDAYEPTVAMDLDMTGQTNDVQMEDTIDAAHDSFMVTLKYDADSEMAVSVCKGEQITLPGTPPQENTTSPTAREGTGLGHIEAVPETPQAESPGFKPINGRQRSVSKSPSPPIQEVLEQEEEDDIDIGMGEADDLIDEDVTMTVELEVEAPLEESTRLSLHEDSETEMLRKFVTRVKADKDAKAAAAARAKSRPKRRSGSTGSITSATGSPIPKMDSLTVLPSQRRPLGAKDLNQSPSPGKKRKPREAVDIDFTKENDRLAKPSLEDTSPPRPKRRRKRMEVETDSVFNPEMDPTQDLTEKGSVRRSTRTRQTRIPLKPTAPSANGALSLIPVRLPGSSGMMQDLDIGPVSGLNLASRHRNEEKDLATVTRVNTRKNKGSSVPPRAVLAMQMDDPTAWKMREVRAVHDAREARSTAAGGGEGDAQVIKVKKGVRWDETLARVQGEDGTEVAVSKTVTVAKIEEPEVELNPPKALEVELPEPSVVEDKEPVVDTSKEAEKLEKADKKPPVRRTRASKLQQPKAVTKPSSIPPRPTTPAPGAQPKPVAKTAATGGSMARMATRRTKVANLGMSGNGTPAPKRRTRA